ncbi:MAG: ion transporter [Solirubrobacterales bacterium]
MSAEQVTAQSDRTLSRWLYVSARRRVHEILAHTKANDTISKAVDAFIVGLILLNVVAMVVESVERVRVAIPAWFKTFELVSVVIFSAEYLLRMWSCVDDPRCARPILGRVRFALGPLAIVDALAVLPFYLPFLGVDLRVFRMFRLFRIMRIMRIAKLARYSDALQMLLRVVKSRKDQLFSAVFILLILLVVAATLMYYAENEAQPKAFSSIPAAMWWAAITLTTVGYGDVYPVTVIGKIMAAMIAMLGIGMFALPTAILGAAFLEDLDRNKKSRKCPHCGKEITGQ